MATSPSASVKSARISPHSKTAIGCRDGSSRSPSSSCADTGTVTSATTLGITPATTKKHLSRIFEKVGVDSRAQLASKLA